MSFEERFALLVESGQVADESVAAVHEVLTGIEAHLGRALDEEADAMLATHLALAVERIRKGEELDEVPEVALAEAQTCTEEWAAAERLLQRAAARWGQKAPQSEIVYLTVHMAVHRADRS